MVPQDAYFSKQQEIGQPLINQLSALDLQMQNILQDTSLPPDQKMQKYDQTLRRYRGLQQEQRNPMKTFDMNILKTAPAVPSTMTIDESDDTGDDDDDDDITFAVPSSSSALTSTTLSKRQRKNRRQKENKKKARTKSAQSLPPRTRKQTRFYGSPVNNRGIKNWKKY